MAVSRLSPYVSFKDNAREAMTFYQGVFGGKLDVTTFKDGMKGMPVEPSEEDKIMHAMLETENGMVIMASDTEKTMGYEDGARISMSLSGDNETELRGYWDKLTQNGKIVIPMDKAPWGDLFGMVTDQFGLTWLVNIGPVATA